MSRYVHWVSVTISALLDFTLAAVTAYLVGGQEPLSTFIVVFLFLLFVPAAFAVWGLVKVGILYWWFARRQLIRQYTSLFRSAKFPQDISIGLDEYLESVISNAKNDIDQRLKAARFAGELSGLKIGKPVAVGMTFHLAAEEALHRYQDDLARRERGDL